MIMRLKKEDVRPGVWERITAELQLPDGAEEAVVMRMPGLLPVEPATVTAAAPDWPMPPWLLADDPFSGRWYLVHTARPRFICRVADDEEEPDPAGLHYITADGQDLCHFVWIDNPPKDLTALLAEAEQYLEDYDDWSAHHGAD